MSFQTATGLSIRTAELWESVWCRSFAAKASVAN
jgi:hypothetical protein